MNLLNQIKIYALYPLNRLIFNALRLHKMRQSHKRTSLLTRYIELSLNTLHSDQFHHSQTQTFLAIPAYLSVKNNQYKTLPSFLTLSFCSLHFMRPGSFVRIVKFLWQSH